MKKLRGTEENAGLNLIVVLFVMMVIMLALIACGSQPTQPANGDRIAVNNDPASLTQRIEYFEDSDVQFEVSKNRRTATLSSASTLRLKLRAEVHPPSIDGQPLHASHVTLDDRNAYVSYSTVNNQFRGGVEIIDIRDVRHPTITSQALFRDTDITIGMPDAGKLLLGEATDSDNNSEFESPACLEIVELSNSLLTNNTARYDLPSFNANDIACFDDAIYVTSGTSDGALSIFDKQSLASTHRISLNGAKAVDRTDNAVVVLEGTGTNIHLFDRKTLKPRNTISLGCTNFFQAKAEMAVVDDIAYLSAWDCGLMIVDLSAESVVATIPPPPGGYTNSVSVSGGRIFIANGGAGLAIAEMDGEEFEIIGDTKFDGSANFVAAKDNLLFVANGAGGLKIIEVMSPVEDIEISQKSSVRADRGASGLVYGNAASFQINTSGLYRVSAEVWYNSGDAQKNESFYLEIRDRKERIHTPTDPNAGRHKVVADDPGEPHVIYRESGTFRLSKGAHKIDLYHYAKIAAAYPYFLNGQVSGPESVHLRGFRLEYVSE